MYEAFRSLQQQEEEAFARGLLVYDNIFTRRQGLVQDMDRGFSLAPWMQNFPNGAPPDLATQDEMFQRLGQDIKKGLK